MHRLVLEIQDKMQAIANPKEAVPMAAYMRNNFLFLGIKKQPRTQATQSILQTIKQRCGRIEIEDIVAQLWELEAREYQYVGIDILRSNLKKLTLDNLELLELLIVQKPWWDTVDILASRIVGTLMLIDSTICREKRDNWLYADHLWLNRTAIIYQLSYKSKTDTEFLEKAISTHINSKEFFIQKAIGWALREYGKMESSFVIRFVEQHPQLRTLSKREALKYL